MKKIILALAGVLVFNLTVVLPAAVALLGDLPEILEVSVSSDKPVTLKTGFRVADENGGSKIVYDHVRDTHAHERRQKLHVYFAEPCDPGRLCLSVEGAPIKEATVTDIVFRRYFVIKRSLKMANRDNAYSIDGSVWEPKDNCMDFWSSERLDLSAAGWVVFGCLNLCVFLLCLFLPVRDCGEKKSLLVSVAVAFAFAYFIGIILPLQSYLVNRSMYDFGVGDFACESLAIFAALFVCSFVSMAFFRRWFGFLPHLIIIAFLAYEYLETGILSSWLPSLNGETSFLVNPRFARLDTFILGFILIVVIGCYRWLKGHVMLCALVVVAMSTISLFDVKQERQSSESSPLEAGFMPKFDVAKCAEYSAGRNVFCFILDSVMAEPATEAVRRDAELRRMFKGFVDYDNNVGMHEFTMRGLPGLMTGQYFEPGMREEDYAASIFSTNSFVYAFARKDYPVYFIPSLLSCGYTNRGKAQEKDKTSSQTAAHPFFKRVDCNPGLSLAQVVRFRMTPFMLKRMVMAITMAGSSYHSPIHSESALFPMLGNAPISSNVTDPTLHVYHTEGTHYPINIDDNGLLLPSPDNTFEGAVRYTRYILKQLAMLMKRLQERGLYDRSMIVVAADHGNPIDVTPKHPQGYTAPGRAFPILWVKPEGNQEAFKVSDLATSHVKIAALMREAVDSPLDVARINAILYEPSRLYSSPRKNGVLKWRIDAKGNAARVDE